MKSAYIAKAKEILKTKRQAVQNKHNEFLEKLRTEYPAFREAESKLNALYFEKARLESLNLSLGDLKEQIENAEGELHRELKTMGVSAEELEKGYYCPLCRDTGEAGGEACACVKREIAALIAGKKDGRVTKKADFDTDFSLFKDAQKEYKTNYSLIKRIANDYPDINTKVILFCGRAGSGKSYLASILANALEQKLHDVIFIKAVRLNKLFLEYHLAPLEEKSGHLSALFDCGMLIIDDLGSENSLNNVTAEYLYQLIIEREDKTTLITTNLSPGEINDIYGSRVFSRLADKSRSLWLKFDSEDLRLRP